MKRCIPLNDAEFSFDSIYEQVIGAGVLPVAIDKNGKIWFLLGKERFISHWRGSLKWSGFEGGRKEGEKVEMTAAREFIEESIGTVSLDEGRSCISSVLRQIENSEYVARIVLCILHGENQERRYHVTYLMQTLLDVACPQEFEVRRNKIIVLREYASLLRKYVMHLQDLPLPREEEEFNSEYVDCITSVYKTPKDVLCVEVYNATDKRHDVLLFDNVSPHMARIYLKWFEVRKTCTVKLEEFDDAEEEMLSITRNKMGEVMSLSINEDYIEKQNIMWWEMQDLKEVIWNGGYSKSNFFRAYFLPVLQRAIEEMDELKMKEIGSHFHCRVDR